MQEEKEMDGIAGVMKLMDKNLYLLGFCVSYILIYSMGYYGAKKGWITTHKHNDLLDMISLFGICIFWRIATPFIMLFFLTKFIPHWFITGNKSRDKSGFFSGDNGLQVKKLSELMYVNSDLPVLIIVNGNVIEEHGESASYWDAEISWVSVEKILRSRRDNSIIWHDRKRDKDIVSELEIIQKYLSEDEFDHMFSEVVCYDIVSKFYKSLPWEKCIAVVVEKNN